MLTCKTKKNTTVENIKIQNLFYFKTHLLPYPSIKQNPIIIMGFWFLEYRTHILYIRKLRETQRNRQYLYCKKYNKYELLKYENMIILQTTHTVFFLSLIMSDTDPPPQYSMTIWNKQSMKTNIFNKTWNKNNSTKTWAKFGTKRRKIWNIMWNCYQAKLIKLKVYIVDFFTLVSYQD